MENNREAEKVLGGSRLNPTRPEQVGPVKKEPASKKTLWLQIAIFGGGTIVLSLLFLMVAFPAMVGFTGRQKSAEYNPEERQFLPQMPVFNAPLSSTNEAELKIAGFAPADSQVQFIIDGKSSGGDLIQIGANGEFSVTLDLLEGENSVAAYTITPDGLESETTQTYKINYDNQTPEIEIAEPALETEIIGKDKKELTIKGTSEPGATIMAGGRRTTVNDEGNFELKYLLNEGDNVISVTGNDEAGNQAEAIELKIKFTP